MRLQSGRHFIDLKLKDVMGKNGLKNLEALYMCNAQPLVAMVSGKLMREQCRDIPSTVRAFMNMKASLVHNAYTWYFPERGGPQYRP